MNSFARPYFEEIAASVAPGIGLEEEAVVALLEVPRETGHGDLALPCFQLAKTMRRAPQQIASEIAEGFEPCSGSVSPKPANRETC